MLFNTNSWSCRHIISILLSCNLTFIEGKTKCKKFISSIFNCLVTFNLLNKVKILKCSKDTMSWRWSYFLCLVDIEFSVKPNAKISYYNRINYCGLRKCGIQIMQSDINKSFYFCKIYPVAIATHIINSRIALYILTYNK